MDRAARAGTGESAGAAGGGWLTGLAAVALALGTLVALHLLRGDSYWNPSEGVYALTSRLLLQDGDSLYRHVVAAQPPTLFVFGAGALAIHDSIGWLRLAVGVAQGLGALAGAGITWRLTGSRVAAVVAAGLGLLTPWAVHEEGLLTPETLAPSLLLPGALWAADRRHGRWAGLALGFGACLKAPYLLPAAAVALVAAERRRVIAAMVVTVLVQAGLALAIFGDGIWRDALLAQLQTGHRRLGPVIVRLWEQAGWNLGPLIACALLALVYRARASDRALLRTTGTLAIAASTTLLSTLKHGTLLNVLAPVEAPLVPLAMAGLVFALRAARRGGWPGRAAAVAGGLALALVLAQSASLLAEPKDPGLFLRPGAPHGWAEALSTRQVAARVERATDCPRGMVFSGGAFFAFVAGRRVPDDQPDRYITRVALLRPVSQRIRADTTRCR